MEEKREIRSTSGQVTIDEESRRVEGYALLFDVPSDGLSFEEVMERGALDGVIEKSDVLAVMNHSLSRGVLARSKKGKGSLTLEVDQNGLKYRFEAPKTALGDELIENLRRGEVYESSLAFTVEKDTWKKKDNGEWKRIIHRFRELYDVSPVYSAAYSATSVYMRGKEEAEKELREKDKQNNSAELSEYYNMLNKSLNY